MSDDNLTPIEYIEIYERACADNGVAATYDGFRQWAQVMDRLTGGQGRSPDELMYEFVTSVDHVNAYAFHAGSAIKEAAESHPKLVDTTKGSFFGWLK